MVRRGRHSFARAIGEATAAGCEMLDCCTNEIRGRFLVSQHVEAGCYIIGCAYSWISAEATTIPLIAGKVLTPPATILNFALGPKGGELCGNHPDGRESNKSRTRVVHRDSRAV